MYPTNRLKPGALRVESEAKTQEIVLRSLEGIIQRIDYRSGELKVVAEGQLWWFAVPADCRFWFDGKLALLRCFQPLNHVRVYYESRGGRQVVRALFGSESGPVPVPADQNG